MSTPVPRPCRKWREWLPEYAEGRLTGRSGAAVAKHVSECARCTEEVKELRVMLTSLHTVAREEMPAHLLAGIRNALREPARRAPALRRAPSLWARLAVPAVAATGLVAIAFALHQENMPKQAAVQAARPQAMQRARVPESAGEAPARAVREPAAAAMQRTAPAPMGSAKGEMGGRGGPEQKVVLPPTQTTGKPRPSPLELRDEAADRRRFDQLESARRAVKEETSASQPGSATPPGPAGPAGPPGPPAEGLTLEPPAPAGPPAAAPSGAGGGGMGGGGARGGGGFGGGGRGGGGGGFRGGTPYAPQPQPRASRRGPYYRPEGRAGHRGGLPNGAQQPAMKQGLSASRPPANALVVQTARGQAIALHLEPSVGQKVRVYAGNQVVRAPKEASANEIVLPADSIGSAPAQLPITVSSEAGDWKFTLFTPGLNQVGRQQSTAARKYDNVSLAKVLGDLSAETGLVLLVEGRVDRPVNGELSLSSPKEAVEQVAAAAKLDSYTEDGVVYTLRPHR